MFQKYYFIRILTFLSEFWLFYENKKDFQNAFCFTSPISKRVTFVRHAALWLPLWMNVQLLIACVIKTVQALIFFRPSGVPGLESQQQVSGVNRLLPPGVSLTCWSGVNRLLPPSCCYFPVGKSNVCDLHVRWFCLFTRSFGRKTSLVLINRFLNTNINHYSHNPHFLLTIFSDI